MVALTLSAIVFGVAILLSIVVCSNTAMCAAKKATHTPVQTEIMAAIAWAVFYFLVNYPS